MLQGVLIYGHRAFRKFLGMCSGHVLTALLNTLSNAIMFACWYISTAPLEVRTWYHFIKVVVAYFYGDDNFSAVRPDLIQVLNRVSYAEWAMRMFSVTITDSSKGTELKPHDPVMSLSFLKRTIRMNDRGIFLPVLETLSITSMLGYVRRHPVITHNEMLETNCETALRYSYFHGHEYFNDLREKIFKTLGIQFPPYSYYEELFYSKILFNGFHEW